MERRLDLGGIFDRAIAIYARSFVPFTAIALTPIVPVACVQYFVALRIQPALDAAVKLLEHPETLAAHPQAALAGSPGALTLAIGAMLFGYFAVAFANAAVAVGVWRQDRDEPVGYGVCYRAAIAAWPAIVGVVALSILAFIVCDILGFIVVAVPAGGVAIVAPSLLPFLVPFATLLFLLEIALVLTVLIVVSGFALCDVTIHRSGAIAAMRDAVRSVCSRAELWRALLCASVLSAIGLAVAGAFDLVALLALARWAVATTAFDALARVLVAPFTAAVLAVYYLNLQPGEIADTPEPEPVYAPTRYLSGEERAAVASFLERRESLGALRRRAVAARLAAPVRARVPLELRRLDDESLLERL